MVEAHVWARTSQKVKQAKEEKEWLFFFKFTVFTRKTHSKKSFIFLFNGEPWKKRKNNLTNVLRQDVAVTFSAEDKKTLVFRQIIARERVRVRVRHGMIRRCGRISHVSTNVYLSCSNRREGQPSRPISPGCACESSLALESHVPARTESFGWVPAPYGGRAAARRACQVNKPSSHVTSSTASSATNCDKPPSPSGLVVLRQPAVKMRIRLRWMLSTPPRFRPLCGKKKWYSCVFKKVST